MGKREEEFEIIEDILDGQRNKYKILVDRYASLVFSVVNRFVDREEDAEELAQEIFVKTYDRLSTFSGKSKFSSWLYMIAMNHCRDYAKNARRKNKYLSEMEEGEVEMQFQSEESPEQDLESKQWSELLKEGLDVITEDHAQAFLLKYQNNMSYKAMSKRLDTSVSALKVRVYRAKKELKTFIEQHS